MCKCEKQARKLSIIKQQNQGRLCASVHPTARPALQVAAALSQSCAEGS